MSERGEKILLILAFAALLATLCSRGMAGLKNHAIPAVADNADMLASADDCIVGDSNVYPNPVSAAYLANTRWGCVPGMPAPLRQTSRGGAVMPQIVEG